MYYKHNKFRLCRIFLTQFCYNIAFVQVLEIEFEDRLDAIAGMLCDDFRTLVLFAHHRDISTAGRVPCNIFIRIEKFYDAP